MVCWWTVAGQQVGGFSRDTAGEFLVYPRVRRRAQGGFRGRRGEIRRRAQPGHGAAVPRVGRKEAAGAGWWCGFRGCSRWFLGLPRGKGKRIRRARVQGVGERSRRTVYRRGKRGWGVWPRYRGCLPTCRLVGCGVPRAGGFLVYPRVRGRNGVGTFSRVRRGGGVLLLGGVEGGGGRRGRGWCGAVMN